MVAPAAMTPSITPPNPRIAFVDTKSGLLTANTGMQILTQHHQALNGLTPTISCTCTTVGNVYTLTPFPVSPNVANYFSYWGFAFVAPATSTGTVTATVTPNTGMLPILPVYIAHGATPAGNTDLTINLFYILYYVDTLNGGNGGFVRV